MTARDIWKQCYRYQRMTQCEGSWQNDLLDRALARMPSGMVTGTDFASHVGQVIAHRQDLLLRRMAVRWPTIGEEQ